MYPANAHVIRAATPADAHVLRRLAKESGRTPLKGRIVVAEVRGAVAAAMSHDDGRIVTDRTLAPPYLASLLRVRVEAVDAFERQPDLRVRLLEAVLGPRPEGRLPIAA